MTQAQHDFLTFSNKLFQIQMMDEDIVAAAKDIILRRRKEEDSAADDADAAAAAAVARVEERMEERISGLEQKIDKLLLLLSSAKGKDST